MSDKSESELMQHKTQLSEKIVTELFEIVASERKDYGVDFADELILSVVSSVVATMVYTALLSTANKKTADRKLSRYAEIKLALQNAISSGFTGAFSTIRKDDEEDFICTVSRVGPPLNKLPI